MLGAVSAAAGHVSQGIHRKELRAGQLSLVCHRTVSDDTEALFCRERVSCSFHEIP